jgi:beta-1,4-N-acetylglucosaminyltransferase
MSGKKTCFVTVGTTKFEALIKHVDSSDVLDALAARGYERVLVQYGKGEFEPFQNKLQNNLLLESYRFKPSLHEDMSQASLIVTHAG